MYKLSAIVRPSGVRYEFCVPIFSSENSNRALLQKLDENGKISDFLDCNLSGEESHYINRKFSRKKGQEALYCIHANEKFIIGNKNDIAAQVKASLINTQKFPLYTLNAYEFLGLKDRYKRQIQTTERFLSETFSKNTAASWTLTQLVAPVIENELRRNLDTLNIKYNKTASHIFFENRERHLTKIVKVACPDFYPEDLKEELAQKFRDHLFEELGLNNISVELAFYKSSPDKVSARGIYFHWSDKQSFIEDLISSGTFARTHTVISKLEKYRNFDRGEVLRLIHAAQTNNQVGWIIEDADVAKFYSSLRNKLSEPLDEKLLDGFVWVENAVK